MSVKQIFISKRVEPKGRIPLNATPSGFAPASSGLGATQVDDTFDLKNYIEEVSNEVLSTGATAQTAALTTITSTAPGTPDYAIQNLTSTTPFGFVTANEGNSVLAVIANLQARVAELETRLAALDIIL